MDQKLVIDCQTGQASWLDLNADEQAALLARQGQPDPFAAAIAAAEQRKADLDALLAQFRVKTDVQAVVGKQPS